MKKALAPVPYLTSLRRKPTRQRETGCDVRMISIALWSHALSHAALVGFHRLAASRAPVFLHRLARCACPGCLPCLGYRLCLVVQVYLRALKRTHTHTHTQNQIELPHVDRRGDLSPGVEGASTAS